MTHNEFVNLLVFYDSFYWQNNQPVLTIANIERGKPFLSIYSAPGSDLYDQNVWVVEEYGRKRGGDNTSLGIKKFTDIKHTTLDRIINYLANF